MRNVIIVDENPQFVAKVLNDCAAESVRSGEDVHVEFRRNGETMAVRYTGDGFALFA